MSGASFMEKEEIKGSAADLLAWSLRQPTVGRCLFCPELEPWTGTALEVRLQAEDHRATVHPEARRSRRRRPSSPPMRMSFNQQMDKDEETLVEDERRRRMKLLGISQ